MDETIDSLACQEAVEIMRCHKLGGERGVSLLGHGRALHLVRNFRVPFLLTAIIYARKIMNFVLRELWRFDKLGIRAIGELSI